MPPGSPPPALGVAAVVDLVEDHQRLAVLGAHPVPCRVAGHLGVGDHDPVVLVRGLRIGVGELGVQRNADPGGGLGPLALEVFGRDDDGDGLDGALGQQLGDYTQGERGFAGTGGRDCQEIPGLGG